ncbi:MAG: NAD(P)-binding domain-containing protein [Bradyrhizobium sp.]|uniref:NADPH-dependent F420 reductase n=1 Tax=Bradyrhizobium sp. TaxID=376 RepID=UPI001D8188A6|nr:NAD(P)-binding domain-containing protein [Bradyrhizobium sp.]MBV9559668.1 NAD(P)-binding domain-containing protein [Bradyrhizobium sp.]
MKIGILGAGNLGTGLAKRLIGRGHDVMLSFSKDVKQLAKAADSVSARSGQAAEAADFADVLILCPPWSAVPQAVGQAGSLANKIIWDCTNPLKADLSGLLLGFSTSAGEEVARLMPAAKVVKAIPPFAELLHSPASAEAVRPAVFVCGDDADAKETVSRLVSDISAEPIDAGPLSTARLTEPASLLLVQLAYKQGLGPRIGTGLLKYS